MNSPDADYCHDHKHYFFAPSRTCYCGALFAFGELPDEYLAVTPLPDRPNLQ